MDLLTGFSDVHETALVAFLALVVHEARKDVEAGKKSNPSGKALCQKFCKRWRNLHHKLASGTYAAAKHSLRVAAKEAEEELSKQSPAKEEV